MRKTAIFMPLLALLAGAVGYFLRHMELRYVFDEHTGLPLRGSSITIALIVLSALFFVIIVLFSAKVKAVFLSPDGFENAFGASFLAYPVIFLIAGLSWFGATIKYFFEFRIQVTSANAELYFLLLSALSSISIIIFAIEVYQNPRRRSKLALSVVPVLFMCFWLIMLYRRNAANPILLNYCYSCLAIMAGTLGFYFPAGFVYKRPAQVKTLVAMLCAVYFNAVTLADVHETSIKVIIAVVIAINLVHSYMLIRCLQRKR